MSLMVVIGYLSWYNRELTSMAKDGTIKHLQKLIEVNNSGSK